MPPSPAPTRPFATLGRVSRLLVRSAFAGASLSLCVEIRAQAVPPPAVEFLFDGTGVNPASTGTKSANAVFIAKTGEPSDLHTPPAMGVSGLEQDRAFTNFGSTQMGSTSMAPGEGGVVRVNAQGLANINTFTLQGWYYNTTRPGNFARLFEGSGVGVFFDGPDGVKGLSFLIGTRAVVAEHSQTKNVYARAKSWNFFAISYDGNAEADNVNFYAGSHNESLQLVGTFTLRSYAMFDLNNFIIGNREDRTRPFRGSIDDFRIWDRVLNAAELEAVRKSDSLTGNSLK